MFATLLGELPRPPLDDDASSDAILDACLALQADHGLEPVTDGGWPLHPGEPVASWRATADRADGLAKAVVVGPWTSGRPVAAVGAELRGLAEAGCRWIEILEPAVIELTGPEHAADRTLFAENQQQLTDGLGPDVHLSLAILGGSADGVGLDTIFAGAYASLALDLIAGPDNWRLAVAAPAEVGIVCGALSPMAGSDDGPELLVWAADYAASTRGRGMDRVGLATAGSLAGLDWETAAMKVRRLGEAARLVTASPEERRAALDPRALDSRSAALGRPSRPPLPRTRPPGTRSRGDADT